MIPCYFRRFTNSAVVREMPLPVAEVLGVMLMHEIKHVLMNLEDPGRNQLSQSFAEQAELSKGLIP